MRALNTLAMIAVTMATVTLSNRTAAIPSRVFLPTTLAPSTTESSATKGPFIPTVLPDIASPSKPVVHNHGTASDEARPTSTNPGSDSSVADSLDNPPSSDTNDDDRRTQTPSNAKTTGFGSQLRESEDKNMNRLDTDDDIAGVDLECFDDLLEQNSAILKNATVFFDNNSFLGLTNSSGSSNLLMLLINHRSQTSKNVKQSSSNLNESSFTLSNSTEQQAPLDPLLNPTILESPHANQMRINQKPSMNFMAESPHVNTININQKPPPSNLLQSMLKSKCRPKKKKKVVPYGSWSSPVSGVMAAAARNHIIEPPRVDPATGHVFWVEEEADEGRYGVVYQYNVGTKNVLRWTASSMDVRTRVHEYGGGSLVPYNNTIYYSSGGDNQLYRQHGAAGTPQQLTNNTNKRYADCSYSPKSHRLFCVCEDHGPVLAGEKKVPANSVVVLALQTLQVTSLLAHADFFAAPRVTEDGTKLAWIEWNHPRMPWDATKVYVAELKRETQELSYHQLLQHGSMMMPSWNSHLELLYVHDMSGWWNLHIIDRRGRERNLTPQSVEVGWPMWRLGRQAYDTNPAVGAHQAVVIVGKELKVINTVTGNSSLLDTGYDTYSLGVAFGRRGKKVYTVAGNGVRFPAVIEVDLKTGSARPLVPVEPLLPEDHISTASLVQFPTTDGMFAYGHLYMPKNPLFEAPSGSLPPLLVRAHHGPTLAAVTTLNMNYQFFTTRGIAILDVDYRGSTGYGKFYRNLLDLKWGVYDVDDVVAGAKQLVEEGVVNGDQLFIDGESAGGFTCLGAVTSTDIFRAGASIYGVSDLDVLDSTTHKFESMYLMKLVGDPTNDRERYILRSPLHFNISTPIIFIHGEEDEVVPISQAEKMHEALEDNGIATAFIRFQGEEHGFRRQRSLVAALEAELFFFSKIANFTLADVTSEVVIDNLDTWHAREQLLPANTSTTTMISSTKMPTTTLNISTATTPTTTSNNFTTTTSTITLSISTATTPTTTSNITSSISTATTPTTTSNITSNISTATTPTTTSNIFTTTTSTTIPITTSTTTSTSPSTTKTPTTAPLTTTTNTPTSERSS